MLLEVKEVGRGRLTLDAWLMIDLDASWTELDQLESEDGQSE